jgi:NAD(P)-dependent dehydrogenase (short-subunit alcohol dehydrogenase family)
LPTDGVKRTVLITGASSGIGEACAVRLARAGWRVYGGVRTAEAAGSLRERGIEPLTLDVTTPADVSAAAERVGETLDGLVDNAGIAIAAPLELVPLDELRRQLEVNVVGQVAVTQAFLPALRRSRGRIVLMGSIGGRSALPFLGPYAASKHALEAVADSLRIELRPWGVAVSIIEPASIATAIWQKGATRAEELRAGFAPDVEALYAPAVASFRKVALSRGPGADPDDVARAVEHALTAGRPKARYVVGRDARIRAAIERLPTRLRDRVLAKALTG